MEWWDVWLRQMGNLRFNCQSKVMALGSAKVVAPCTGVELCGSWMQGAMVYYV
ncbi:MAG: hypothetical protein ACTS4T_01270 [Candidatus Hodgkinia cicadicola]